MQSSGTRLSYTPGQATAIAQHGELFQGLMQDEHGNLRRCLLSLPCANLCSVGTFTPDEGSVSVQPAHKQKALRAAELTLKRLNAPFTGGKLVVESNIPEGKGMGSSTADCIAAVLAVAQVIHARLSPEQIAEIVVRAETASGNVMFNHAVLFAQREGKVLENYYRTIPSMVVLGFDTEDERIVETLLFPPAVYSYKEIQKFQVLIPALRRAVQTQDARLLARVATASAEINQQFLPKPLFRDVCDLASKLGALGVAVAHSGTVAGILLDIADVACERKVELLQKCLESLGIHNILQFQT